MGLLGRGIVVLRRVHIDWLPLNHDALVGVGRSILLLLLLLRVLLLLVLGGGVHVVALWWTGYGDRKEENG